MYVDACVCAYVIHIEICICTCGAYDDAYVPDHNIMMMVMMLLMMMMIAVMRAEGSHTMSDAYSDAL